MLKAGKVSNGDCATPAALDLLDGDPNAERVMLSIHRKTGKVQYSICAPWLLSGIFA